MQNQTTKRKGAYAKLTGFRRAVPIILTALAVFIAFCFVLQDTGAFGRAISSVLLGLFSIGGYFIPAFLVIHAVFYASDVLEKRTLSRVIFTAITVITIAALTHAVTYWDEGITFSAKSFYENGTNAKGGGFLGGTVAFALTKVFGNVGLIIIAIALFALYVTYYFSSAKTLLFKALLKMLNAISGFFSSYGKKRKTSKAQRKIRLEERQREMLAAEQDMLIDDDFFEADNGLKELKITELGISEVRDDAEIERNPHLEKKVRRDTESVSSGYGKAKYAESSFREAHEVKRRTVNMDYSTVNSSRPLSNSTSDSIYEPKASDIIYDEPITSSSDESADALFSRNFEPFDFKLNEELSNKPSSKAMKANREPEGISEITEPITEITYEDVEKARQRADFEMKKKMAIEAQKRYAAAEAEASRIKEENARAAEAAPSQAEDFYSHNAAPSPTETDFRNSEPYIPEYMKTVNEEAHETATEMPEENEYSAKRAESFESAINGYEQEIQSKEFKPYTPPSVNDSFEQDLPTEENTEELKITRAMLEPTPTATEVTKETEASENDSEDGADYAFDTAESFDSYTAESTDGSDDDEEAMVFDFSAADAEEVPGDSLYGEEEEIPPEEQNADVIEQRKLFPFLDDNKDSDTTVNSSDDSAYAASDSLDAQDNSELKSSEDEPPFEAEPKRSVFAERMMQKTAPAPKPVEEKPVEEKPDYSDYQYPSVELLAKGKIEEDLNQEEEKNQNAEKLVDALLQFNVRISIKGIDRGPRITRYEIVPARGVKVNSVTNLFNDIALNLGVEGMRMEAPIPGKSAIGVEIPNKKPSTVLLRDLVESDEFICASSKTMSCLGKDVTGNPVFADIAKMPHVLVAGATGMGKSVCINSILISILYKARPDEVKFIMIDPKKVEFNGYNGIPHLLIPVVTDVKQAAGALMWAVEQMEKRYDLMEALEVRKLDSYNEKVREHPELGEPLPKIIIVIDELNDIMLQVRKPAEDLIMSIAQKARAAGIHLIIGTQRPSVDVITGVIKANIPSRISCKVASYNDSKTILEQAGAEKLLNNGDMLYIPAGAPKALRVQGAFVSDGEVTAIMKFLKSQAKGSVYDSQALEEINRAAQKCSKGKGGDDFDDGDGDDGENLGVLNDQQFLDAVDLAIKSGKISTSLIQRRISVGYGKAAKFIDIMEDMGIVSEPNGQKPRDILITKDEWHEMLSRRSLD